ncbi:MAG TPA: AtpZ/AtpI family protein [Acidobacteriota bacterium]|nr:AtpZ/AtpI family protein [Acidobacteriota bacterium]
MASTEDRRRTTRLLAHYASVVFILPSAVLGGYMVGRWLDGKFDTFPWLTTLMVLLGTVGGFIEIFRILSRKP